MAYNITFLASILSSFLVSLSLLVFYTDPLIALSSLCVSIYAMFIWTILKKGERGFMWIMFVITLIHCVYFFELDPNYWLIIFLMAGMSVPPMLELDAFHLTSASIILQALLLPELIMNVLLFSASANPFFLVLEGLLLLYSGTFSAVVIFQSGVNVRKWLYFLAQFLFFVDLAASFVLWLKVKPKSFKNYRF